MQDTDAVRGSAAAATRNAKGRMASVSADDVRAFLAAQPEVTGSIDIERLELLTEGSGASNGIAFVDVTLDRGTGPNRLELVVRFQPGVQLLKQKRFEDEFLTLRAVHATGVPSPTPLWLDADGTHLGTPGYAMERVTGQTPNSAMYSSGLLAECTSEDRKAMLLEAAAFHAHIRRAAISADVVPHLVDRGVGASPIERELSWWLEEVRLAVPQHDHNLAYVSSVHRWLVAHQPQARLATLVHGDAQPANLMFRDGEVVAGIDWELAYLGHGEADLALLVFLTDAQLVIDTHVDGTPSEQEYIDRYEAVAGAPVEHWEFFRCVALFKVAAMVAAMADVTPNHDAVFGFYRSHLDAALASARAVTVR